MTVMGSQTSKSSVKLMKSILLSLLLLLAVIAILGNVFLLNELAFKI